jgi:hypothetical protein
VYRNANFFKKTQGVDLSQRKKTTFVLKKLLWTTVVWLVDVFKADAQALEVDVNITHNQDH